MARYLSGPTQPFGKWNGIPIYLSTILTALLAIGFLGSALLAHSGATFVEALLLNIPFRPVWALWRPLTYVLVQPMDFFTPFSIFCFYWFAVGIETHLGRAPLSRLLILLALVPLAVGAVFYVGFGQKFLFAGSSLLIAGLMVAFATLYPNTEAWGWIPFKWMAFACVFCGTVMLLGQPAHLAILWVSCAVGFAYMRHARELEHDDYVSPVSRVKDLFRRKPKFRVVPAPSNSSYRETLNQPDSELDTLLDKIAKSGMDSLTSKEKATLQKAREALIRKDQR
jgi:hypothetical protein